jgi:hypothetical protein
LSLPLRPSPLVSSPTLVQLGIRTHFCFFQQQHHQQHTTRRYDGSGKLEFGMDATVVSRRKGRVDLHVELTCDPSCWYDKAGWLP